MKKIMLLIFLTLSVITFSMARVGTDIGMVPPGIEADGYTQGSNLGKITILNFWQST